MGLIWLVFPGLIVTGIVLVIRGREPGPSRR
jgi:hypothetical protein